MTKATLDLDLSDIPNVLKIAEEAARDAGSYLLEQSGHATVKYQKSLGIAAADLAYVSCGRAEALINHATHPWDIEADKILLLEAGGKVTTLERHNGNPLTIYSNNILHQAIKELLKD